MVQLCPTNNLGPVFLALSISKSPFSAFSSPCYFPLLNFRQVARSPAFLLHQSPHRPRDWSAGQLQPTREMKTRMEPHMLSSSTHPVKCLAGGKSQLLFSHINITHLPCLNFTSESNNQNSNVCGLSFAMCVYLRDPLCFTLLILSSKLYFHSCCVCDQILQNCLTTILNFWISLCMGRFVLRNFPHIPVASIST